ncbi:MAG: Rho termination factor N-terminal domain-containing protein, partial [Kineosporiaceae bacterium]
MTDTTQIAAADSAPAVSGSSPRGSLSALRLPELQAVAAQLGISGTARMRKSDLLDAIKAKQSGGDASSSAPPPVRASRRAAAAAGPPSTRAEGVPDDAAEPADRPFERVVVADRVEAPSAPAPT